MENCSITSESQRMKNGLWLHFGMQCNNYNAIVINCVYSIDSNAVPSSGWYSLVNIKFCELVPLILENLQLYDIFPDIFFYDMILSILQVREWHLLKNKMMYHNNTHLWDSSI